MGFQTFAANDRREKHPGYRFDQLPVLRRLQKSLFIPGRSSDLLLFQAPSPMHTHE